MGRLERRDDPLGAGEPLERVERLLRPAGLVQGSRQAPVLAREVGTIPALLHHYAQLFQGLLPPSETGQRAPEEQVELIRETEEQWVETDVQRAQARFPERHDPFTTISGVPIERLYTPADIAEWVVFLSSGKARYATGATIDVNGASYLH